MKAGREEEFERRFADVLTVLTDFPGHVLSRLFRDVNAPQSYLVYSEWKSQETFSAFLHSEAFTATTAWAREDILSERPHHSVFTGRQRA